MESYMVMEHGTVVKRYADGRTDALLANSNVGTMVSAAGGRILKQSTIKHAS
jgi:hypothetical protein